MQDSGVSQRSFFLSNRYVPPNHSFISIQKCARYHKPHLFNFLSLECSVYSPHISRWWCSLSFRHNKCHIPSSKSQMLVPFFNLKELCATVWIYIRLQAITLVFASRIFILNCSSKGCRTKRDLCKSCSDFWLITWQSANSKLCVCVWDIKLELTVPFHFTKTFVLITNTGTGLAELKYRQFMVTHMYPCRMPVLL